MKISKSFISLILFISTPLFAMQHEIASNVIVVKTPLVAKQSSAQNATEVFMELINRSEEPHKLIAATSPIASQVQLHETINNKGNRMQKIDSISIKNESEKDLKPGGLHVMLIGLKEKLIKNNFIPITLIFNDGSWLKVRAKVD